MTAIETPLSGCYIIKPRLFEDERGYFMESYNQHTFESKINNKVSFIQDNQSYSVRGVMRGLHYQVGEFAQAKLVRVLQGEVLDVAVDIRPNSPTFGEHIAVVLSEQNQDQLFIPRGFAHGFIVLSQCATFFYKCDNVYNKEAEGGIIFNDPDLAIDWKTPFQDLIISDKDLRLPLLKNARRT